VSVHELDSAKAEAFAARMISIINSGMLSLMVSVGHRTGLFDTMAGMAPSSSAGIATAAALDERYVREWLGAMTTGRIVELDPDTGTYRLPPEHAGIVTRAAGLENLASFAQNVAMLGLVESDIVRSFLEGGGVPYARFPDFQHVMAEGSGAVHDAALIDGILPLVDGLVDRLQAGIAVADVGCGSGHAINLMAEAFPKSRFVGYDFSEAGIAAGTAEAAAKGLSNATFEVRDAATLGRPPRFDLVTVFDAIHDQAQPRRVLKGIADCLRDDGVFLCVDVRASSNVHENLEHPLGPFLYTISCMHCMTVSLAQNGEGLGAVWGEQKALELLAEAGFGDVEVKTVDGDIVNNYYIARK
jgi:SAM-dependent methyltransferase